ncbi:MAG: LysE family transporter [Pseudomonadota bacterium]
MIAFAAALFFLIITPGPGVLTTAGIGSGFGYRAGLRFLAGLFISTNLVCLAVVTGVAATLFSVPYLRSVLLYASVAYLLYLAARIAFSGSKIAFIRSHVAPGFLIGLGFQAINPKAYAVNTFLFSGFPFWPDSILVETAIKFLIMNVIWVPVHLAWLAAGVYLQRLDLSQRTMFFINLMMALAMLIVVGLAARSELLHSAT